MHGGQSVFGGLEKSGALGWSPEGTELPVKENGLLKAEDEVVLVWKSFPMFQGSAWNKSTMKQFLLEQNWPLEAQDY